MALDGAFLYTIKNEIYDKCIGARVDKIYQTSKYQIVILLRSSLGNYKLLLDAGHSNPRIHLSNMNFQNPSNPPMFCMLLRKYLNNSKLLNVRQAGLDRILFLDFNSLNDFGDLVTITLAIEIIPRQSNILLINHQNKIIDAIKRIPIDNSNTRTILPSVTYTLPNDTNKIDITNPNTDINTIYSTLEKIDVNNLEKQLIYQFQGISPLLSREIICLANILTSDNITSIYKKISDALFYLKTLLTSNNITPTILLDNDNQPKDFSFININQYHNLFQKLTFNSPSELLDYFYVKSDSLDKIKQKTSSLLKLLNNKYNRTIRKLNMQRQELLKSQNREHLKLAGDLIFSNIYQLQKGQSKAILQNFYDPQLPDIEISLDSRLSPNQNAQKYYSEYKKSVNAEKVLVNLIKNGELELTYIESLIDNLNRIQNDDDLIHIKAELSEAGYIKNYSVKNKNVKSLQPLKYISTDGFTILCGRNNKQNDLLTTKLAKPTDIWLHTKDIPGSHVIIVSDGKQIPQSTIEQATMIAAFNSKARYSSKIPVDYTFIKNVKKPNGSKPGMVIFHSNKTAIITPDENLVDKLKT